MKPSLFLGSLVIAAVTVLAPFHEAHAAWMHSGPVHPIMEYDFADFDELYATRAMGDAERPQLLLKSGSPSAQALITCVPLKHGLGERFSFSSRAWPQRELRIEVYDFQLGAIGFFHFGRFHDLRSCFDYLARMEINILARPVRLTLDLFDNTARFPIIPFDQNDRFLVKRNLTINNLGVRQ